MELSELELEILNQSMNRKKICICNGVTEEEIIESIQKGNTTLDAISKDTFAMTKCGSCTKKVQEILSKTLKKR